MQLARGQVKLVRFRILLSIRCTVTTKMNGFQLVLYLAIGMICAVLFRFYHEKHPDTKVFLARTTPVGAVIPLRLAQAVGYQLLGRTPMCDYVPGDLAGQVIVLTGGNTGIGYETAKGLVRRGAHVVMVGRSQQKVEEAANNIRAQLIAEEVSSVSLQYIISDMSDLDSVSDLVLALQQHFGSRSIDQLILNAAIWPKEYSVSAQGYEVAFATNVVGPHLLLRALADLEVLKPSARVISVTGELYITVAGGNNEGCSQNFSYGTPAGQAGQDAYCRSKLGLMWLFYKLHERYPQLHMNLVHPGVMDNNLTDHNSLPKPLLISDAQGAQTTLICATAPLSLLENGGYYHNTLGKVVLPANDPVRNEEKAEAFWDLVEGIVAPYLHALAADQPASADPSGGRGQ
jgi:retinol dehydrogenase-12